MKDDFSYLMRAGAARTSGRSGVDFSNIPFEGDNTGSPLGSWTFPQDAPYNANDPTTYPTQYTNSLPTYANIPTKTFAGLHPGRLAGRASGLTFNLGLRYDLQIGSFNEDVPDLLASIEDKLGRDGSFPLDVVGRSSSRRPSRGDYNNFGPRVGLAWDPAEQRRARTSTRRTGCSTTTCGRCRTSAS